MADCTARQSARLLLRTIAPLAILALAGGWSAAPARADGDPASDVLATQPLFLPQDAAASPLQQAQLAALLREAARGGHPIRLALIASPTDLGSVTELWGRPQTYARFLGQELSSVYRGPLLVVMPSGYGTYDLSAAAAPLRSALPAPAARGGLAPAALSAIRAMAAASGHPLPAPTVKPSTAGTRGGSASWIAFGVGAILVAAAWAASLRARPLRPRRRTTSA